MNKKLEEAINTQLNFEIESAFVYLAMKNYLEGQSLDGFVNWFDVQFQEEMAHAQKFMNYVNERDGRVVLEEIAKPETNWESPVKAFSAAYKHEQFISASINELISIARDEKDFMSDNFLQWFVAEQVEEEASAKEVIRMFKLAGSGGGGLLMIDKELASRVFTPPTTN